MHPRPALRRRVRTSVSGRLLSGLGLASTLPLVLILLFLLVLHVLALATPPAFALGGADPLVAASPVRSDGVTTHRNDRDQGQPMV